MENQQIQDRIGKYLTTSLKDFLFDQLSEDYLKKEGLTDILKDVSIPIRATDGQDFSVLKIAENMAFVIGCDPNFAFRDSYVAYINRIFGKDFVTYLVAKGIELATKEDYFHSCVLFRAALILKPRDKDALYCYGRSCKDIYSSIEDEDAIARFKAESLEAFEKLTLEDPNFDMGFYYLGYGYLNLGLYIKADLTFKDFVKLSSNKELVDEVKEWLEKLEHPVIIEQGYNKILSGMFTEGIEILNAYVDDERFNSWWPLWYYLGTAYDELEDFEPAKEALLKVLTLCPSNMEAMERLAKIYKNEGNYEKEEKYLNKIEVIKGNIIKDRELAEENKKQD